MIRHSNEFVSMGLMKRFRKPSGKEIAKSLSGCSSRIFEGHSFESSLTSSVIRAIMLWVGGPWFVIPCGPEGWMWSENARNVLAIKLVDCSMFNACSSSVLFKMNEGIFTLMPFPTKMYSIFSGPPYLPQSETIVKRERALPSKSEGVDGRLVAEWAQRNEIGRVEGPVSLSSLRFKSCCGSTLQLNSNSSFY